jgi:hypothetical protein
MLKLTALVLALTGCHATLGDAENNSATADANGGGGGGNGGGGGSGNGSGGGGGGMMMPDAGVSAACARLLYLNFAGVTLTQATASDSTQNRASWLTTTSSAVPPWHQGASQRANDITTIVNGVKSRLANTPIKVVTTRPTSGPYVMVVFGGERTGDGGTVGTIYSQATNEHDCGDVVKNDIGWVSDTVSVSYAQDLTIGAIGWGVGLNGTSSGDDCMCGWANNCDSNNGACTLATSIATTTSASPATTCPNQNPQNEVAAFTTKFCAP